MQSLHATGGQSHINCKGLVAGCHSFCLFFIFYNIHTFIHSITFIQYIYPSPFAEVSLHFLIACLLSGETPPCGAKPRIELGPALQQADALPTEPRGTIAEPGRTIKLSHAAYKLYPSGRQSHINCTQVAASRMQIVPAWPPVTCNKNKSAEIFM
jgi:hypothetical protein